MIYSAVIEVKGDTEELYRCLMSERRMKEDRATLEIKKLKGKLRFTISAKDSVALRATFNSVSKLFTVYEKIEGVSNGERNRTENQ